eukprot:NODE_447_length_7292_cov_0.701932.p4 type:complete len:332 gc:universal NODE_447_length_7292_cov_0.701932:2305-1310(-)
MQSTQMTQLTNDDYTQLRDSLKKYIATDTSELVPPLVRMSFHDLINYDPSTNEGGPHGCLMEKSVLNFTENAGLDEDVNNLHKYVISQFPKKPFTFGDVISLAGKVAIETAYPCIQIKWRYGRSKCVRVDEQGTGANGTFHSLEEFKPVLDRYGLTPQEMAILTAGSHGLATAAAEVEHSGFGDFDFAEINSGKDWIVKSLNQDWQPVKSSKDNLQFTSQLGNTTILRLPSDLVFFPRVLTQIGTNTADTSANYIQDSLEVFARSDRSLFDNQFATVYSKMLEIGTVTDHLTEFQESTYNGICTDTGFEGNSSASASFSFIGLFLILMIFK